ncbi:hypothetical protein B0H13DRAFT_1877330 [Mycena leptocephala]|nr:hypothetical protein B0H13DRAFT_1877330 [Mycena leptocephala]
MCRSDFGSSTVQVITASCPGIVSATVRDYSLKICLRTVLRPGLYVITGPPGCISPCDRAHPHLISTLPGIIFHLHSKFPETDGIPVDGHGSAVDELRKTVAAKFSVPFATTVSFHKSAPPDTTLTDLKALSTIHAILAERAVVLPVSGKKVRSVLIRIHSDVRPVPGPTGGSPFISGYSEIYPDFMGNYQRLLAKYGHMVHVSYLGKSIYLTDDPDCAGIGLSEGEFFKKEANWEEPSAIRVEDDLPKRAFYGGLEQPGLVRTSKAMRDYIRTMDHTANQLLKLFQRPCLRTGALTKFRLPSKEKSFNAFQWRLSAAGQTIGEIAFGIDFKMLDGQVAEIFQCSHVTVALHSLMVNPEHLKDPLTFDPDRWGTEEVRKRHKYAYISFAAEILISINPRESATTSAREVNKICCLKFCGMVILLVPGEDMYSQRVLAIQQVLPNFTRIILHSKYVGKDQPPKISHHISSGPQQDLLLPQVVLETNLFLFKMNLTWPVNTMKHA